MLLRILRKLLSMVRGNHEQPGRMKTADAVSAVFFYRENQKNLVFMIKRQGSVKCFPGYVEFPRGNVDKNDVQIKSDHAVFSAHKPQLMAALCGEVKKTLGFDLEQAARSGLVKHIHPVGTALTFEFALNRWNTHFFVIELKEKPGFTVDTEAVSEAEWKTPAEYVRLYEKGQMPVLPSTINLLKIMKTDLINSGGSDFVFHWDETDEVPCFQPVGGINELLPIAFTFPPYLHRTNCFVIGDPGEKRFVVDPSPQDDKEYKKLVNTLKKIEFTDIFITHHHPDHHQGAPRLARDFSIPITMSKDAHQRLLKRKGKKYFENVEIKYAQEGDMLTRWFDKAVKVYEIPGHDEGQLALAPESMEWFLVGDLIQDTGAGTVVIGGEEGDMAKYFRTLERIIQLDPKVLLPSHGIVVGSTHRLKQTLEHRKYREKQVLTLCKKGNTPEQMVKMLYRGVDRRLWPLALENIKSHLKKLEQEKAIKL